MTSDNVDIERIMQEIRQEILARRLPGQEEIPLGGKRLPPEFYEHLYQAGLIQSQLGVKMHVTRSNVPIIGRLLEWFRARLHELVIFYINQLAEQQAEINGQLLRALSILSQSLEEEAN